MPVRSAAVVMCICQLPTWSRRAIFGSHRGYVHGSVLGASRSATAWSSPEGWAVRCGYRPSDHTHHPLSTPLSRQPAEGATLLWGFQQTDDCGLQGSQTPLPPSRNGLRSGPSLDPGGA